MGNNNVNDCSQCPPPPPNTTNQCSPQIDDYYTVPNACTPAEPINEPGLSTNSSTILQNRRKICAALSDKNEWQLASKNKSIQPSIPESCNLNLYVPWVEYNGPDCNSSCKATGDGNTVICQRQTFTGDPLECCKSDLFCNPQNNQAACFSDFNRQSTCSPCYRSMTATSDTVYSNINGVITTCGQQGNNGCQDILLDYCTGKDVDNIQDLVDRWYTMPGFEAATCTKAIERNIFQNLPSPCMAVRNIPFTDNCRPTWYNSTYASSNKITTTNGNVDTAGTNVGILSSSGIAWATKVFDGVVIKYNSLGFSIGSVPGQIGYNQFQDYLYSICCQVPIICQNSLNNSCSIYSAKRLSVNPDATNWCGCYLPNSEYASYVEDYQVNKECTPMCNRISTIPNVNGANQPLLCTQDVCIIDDVTINLSNSNLDGNANISQVCGNCSGTVSSTSTCSCILSNNTLDGAQTNIDGFSLQESCSSITCNVKNPGVSGLPRTIQVPCDQASDPDSVYAQALQQLAQGEIDDRRTSIIIYLIILVIFLLLIALIYFIIKPNLTETVEKRYYAVPPKEEKAKIATPPQKPTLTSAPLGSKDLTYYSSYNSTNEIGSRWLD